MRWKYEDRINLSLNSLTPSAFYKLFDLQHEVINTCRHDMEKFDLKIAMFCATFKN